MKKTYKYIHFVKTEDKPKTAVYSCRNNKSGEELGIVKWYGSWRQYCYFPTCPAVYNKGWLQDIQNFINELWVMPTQITLILETAVYAKFITVEEVYSLAMRHSNDWSIVCSLLCKQARIYRYKDYEAYKTILETADQFWRLWKLENY